MRRRRAWLRGEAPRPSVPAAAAASAFLRTLAASHDMAHATTWSGSSRSASSKAAPASASGPRGSRPPEGDPPDLLELRVLGLSLAAAPLSLEAQSAASTQVRFTDGSGNGFFARGLFYEGLHRPGEGGSVH